MIEDMKDSKLLSVGLLLVVVGGAAFTVTQTDVLSTSPEVQDSRGDAMEAGQAMRAQEDLGEDSTGSNESVDNTTTSTNTSTESDDMSMNGSMDQ